MKKTTRNYNVLDHWLVPKMEVMKKSEVEKLLKEYDISLEDLPVFLKDDPSVVALGAKPGDVVRIHREDLTGSYFYYRRVIE